MKIFRYALYALVLSTPCAQTMQPNDQLCILQPIIHATAVCAATAGIGMIRDNTTTEIMTYSISSHLGDTQHEELVYRMTNIKKALTGYALVGLASAASACTYLYCLNSK